MPLSHDIFKTYSILPSVIRYSLTHHWNVQEAVKPCLSEYRLYSMTAHSFVEHFKDGVIILDGIKYVVYFQHTSFGHIKWLVHRRDQRNLCLLLSLRVPNPDIKLAPLALVQVALRSLTPEALKEFNHDII